MEREAAQLRDMQAGYAHGNSPAPGIPGGQPLPEDSNMEGDEDKEAADLRSVYVGNVCAVVTFLVLFAQKLIERVRSIMVRHRKKYKHIFNHVER